MPYMEEWTLYFTLTGWCDIIQIWKEMGMSHTDFREALYKFSGITGKTLVFQMYFFSF